MKLLDIILEQKGISYCGVILDEESKEKILKAVDIPSGWKVINHHMTIKLGGLPENLKDRKGEKVTLKVISLGKSDKAIALGIETNLSTNKKPHVTVAINVSNGGKTKDSNDIVDWENIESFFISGTIDEVGHNVSSKTILNVFDFDGTLMDSPLPEEGKKLYKQITGEKYPHNGWWGKIESLQPFDVKPIEKVKKLYNTYSKKPNSINVLMTNRIGKFEPVIKEKINGIYSFDIYNFKTDSKEKPERIEDILKDHPTIKIINIFDDMDEQIKLFNEFKERHPELEINIFHVKPDFNDKKK